MPTDTFPVEVFATGQWGGRTWTAADLDQMAANFARLLPLGIKPPVKLGHDDSQVLAGQKDGDPALGWVAGLRRVGTKLLADIANVPTVLRELVKAGRYKRVSSEIYPAFEATSAEANLHSGVTGHVLSAVAFLGADVPEVKTLEDLGAYLHIEPLAFSVPGAEVIAIVTPRHFAGTPGSVFAYQCAVNEAVMAAFGMDAYVVDLFDDAVIVQQGERTMRVPVTRDGDDVSLGQAVEVAVSYQPVAASEHSPSHPRTTPIVEEPMTDAEKTAAADAQAKLDAKLAELTDKITASEAERAHDRAELARLKAENDRLALSARIAESVARNTAAERFFESRMRPENLRFVQAQRSAAITLHTRLAELGTVVKLTDGLDVKLFAEGETPRDLTLVELYERSVDAGPQLKALLTEVSRATAPATDIATASTVAEVVQLIAQRDKLDLRKAEHMRQATQLAMTERPDLKRNYGSAA